MFIEIESTEFTDRQVTARRTGEVLFIREQPALMFKEGSKYPDKFLINVAFTSNENERNSAQVFQVGKYVLADEAFYVNNNNQGAVNYSRIKLLKQDQNKAA